MKTPDNASQHGRIRPGGRAFALVILVAIIPVGMVFAQGTGVPSLDELQKKLEGERAHRNPAPKPRPRHDDASTDAALSEQVGRMVEIAAGDYRMGDAIGDGQPDEKPVHSVHIRAFRIAGTTVTRAQFAAFVRDTGYRTDAERDAGGAQGCYTLDLSGGKWAYRAGYSWRDPGFVQADTHPIVCVSFDDAQAYIEWLNRKTQRHFRLPSEAEWEYAARAGSVAKYPWGMDADQGCRYANGADQTPWPDAGSFSKKMECKDGYFYTAPVASFQANDFGLFDMIGNVWQWTADCYHVTYEGAPGDGSAWTSGDCSRRVLRGGSWYDNPANLRVSYRRNDTTNRNDNIGFRLAQDP